MADHELTAYGDKELWYITGAIPEGDWSLPIYVHRYQCDDHQYVRIAPISAYPQQAAKIRELFSDKSIWQENGQYMVDVQTFESIAHKAPGITPDCYRHWPGKEYKVDPRLQVKVQSDDSNEPPDEAGKFLRFVCTKTGVSHKLLRMCWWAMAEAGPDWLAAKHRPIDLGYATIYPFPYRANWKDYVFESDISIANSFKLSQKELERDLINKGFIPRLWDVKIMGVNPHSHRLHWTLEVVPSKTFEQRIEQIEIHNLRSGCHRYVERYEQILDKLLPSILWVFGSWLEKIALPFGKVINSRMSSKRRLVPDREKPTAPPEPDKLSPVAVAFPVSYLKNGKKSPKRALRAKVVCMPKMPPVRPPVDDMRVGEQGGDREAIDVLEPTNPSA